MVSMPVMLAIPVPLVFVTVVPLTAIAPLVSRVSLTPLPRVALLLSTKTPVTGVQLTLTVPPVWYAILLMILVFSVYLMITAPVMICVHLLMNAMLATVLMIVVALAT